MGHARLIGGLALAVSLGVLRPCAAETEPARPDFDGLWTDAQRWAAEVGTAPEDCVFEMRLDPRTNAARNGRAVTCDEPYRSPFYPYPAPSRAGVRFTADDIRAYARVIEAESGRPWRPEEKSDAGLFETCGIVVGFTPAGVGAEAIECHWRDGGVLGQRANAGYLVERDGGGRIASRLHDRLAHLKDRAMRAIAARLARAGHTDGPSELQIEGRVVGRDGHRLMIRGQARPAFGGSRAEPGVVTQESDLVVEYPSDDALRPGYYFAGEHCFKGMREKVGAGGAAVTEWTYGPCALGRGQYWMFERHPPGRKSVMYGPYAEYAQCERDRRRTRTGRMIASVAGHCERRAKAVFRMTNDGSLVAPRDAPALD